MDITDELARAYRLFESQARRMGREWSRRVVVDILERQLQGGADVGDAVDVALSDPDLGKGEK